jgi:hypothetical protein
MSCHDCHVMLTQLLPVELRGVVEDHICVKLPDLCNAFNVILRKSISLKHVERLKEDIVVM